MLSFAIILEHCVVAIVGAMAPISKSMQHVRNTISSGSFQVLANSMLTSDQFNSMVGMDSGALGFSTRAEMPAKTKNEPSKTRLGALKPHTLWEKDSARLDLLLHCAKVL